MRYNGVFIEIVVQRIYYVQVQVYMYSLLIIDNIYIISIVIVCFNNNNLT